jgi:HEAT repeat protein
MKKGENNLKNIVFLLIFALPVFFITTRTAAENLQENGNPLKTKCINILKDSLQEPPGVVKIHAAEALIANGEKETVKQAFRRELVTDDPIYRVLAARVLFRAGKKETVNIITAALKDPNGGARVHAAEALGKLKYGGAKKLLHELADSPEPRLRIYVLFALASIGEKSAVPEIIKSLENQDPGVRLTAAFSLGETGERSAIPRLEKLLAQETGETNRCFVAGALLKLGLRSTYPLLLNGLKSKETAARAYSALFLGAAREKNALNDLKKLLGDKDADVRVRAAEAILEVLK